MRTEPLSRPSWHPEETEVDSRAVPVWLPWAIGMAGITLLAWHASTYLPFVADDSLISLRYAQRFLEGKGLTWTDGERVEGYSNLLWVLATAALGFLGIDLIRATWVLGLAGMGAAIAAVVYLARPRTFADLPGAILPAFAMAATGVFATWAIGGLEQPMVAGFLAWAMVLCLPLVREGGADRTVGAGLCLAGLVLTRPDGPLFTAMAALVIVVSRGLRPRTFAVAARLVSIPFAAWLGQLAFRWFYYGDWVANTARVKVAFSSIRLVQGLSYVGNGLLWLGGITALGLLGVAALTHRERRARIAFLLVPLLAWLGYVASVGGDIFPSRRHLVPAIVLLALLAAEGLSWITRRSPAGLWFAWIGGTAAVASLFYFQLRDPENIRAHRERWEWDGKVVGELLKTSFGDKAPLLAVDPAGCLPYFSELPSLDLLGLNDAWLARNPPEGFGTGYLGHELGNGAYVLSRRPDLLVFCGPAGSDRGCFLSGRELVRDPTFRREYFPVTFEGRVPHTYRSRVWVRREGGPIGVVRREDSIEVPGYFFAGPSGTIAHLDTEGRLGTTIPPGAKGSARVEVPAGTWEIAPIHSGGAVQIAVRSGRTAIAAGRDRVSFSTAGGPVDIDLSTEEPSLHVQRVTLAVQDAQPAAAQLGGPVTGTP